MICDIFQFNVICCRRSLAALVLSWRLVESDVTVTPSVTRVDWLCWWYNHAADLVHPSTALTFVTEMTEKCKATSSGAIQVKNLWKTVNTEEKLDVINHLEKGEQITGLCHKDSSILVYVQFMIMLIELQRVLSQELKWFCSKTTTVLSEWTVPKTTDVSLLHFYCFRNK